MCEASLLNPQLFILTSSSSSPSPGVKFTRGLREGGGGREGVGGNPVKSLPLGKTAKHISTSSFPLALFHVPHPHALQLQPIVHQAHLFTPGKGKCDNVINPLLTCNDLNVDISVIYLVFIQ